MKIGTPAAWMNFYLTCANNFYGTGSYYLRRVYLGRVEKDICTYCGQRPGFDYEVIKRKQEAEK